MEQHPIPRQITSFEFKLIGFMTLKQFIYLLIFTPTGYVVYMLFPIPLINILLGVLVAGLGVALAFLPINERPLDVWIKNLFKRLRSPTQFTFQKNNSPLYFLEDLYFVSDPHRMVSHIESKEKLAEYLEKTQPKKPSSAKKKNIQSLLKTPTAQIQPKPVFQQPLAPIEPVVVSTPTPPTPELQTSVDPITSVPEASVEVPASPPQEPTTTPVVVSPTAKPRDSHTPFLTGMVKNNRQIPLPGIMVYIKNQQNIPIRLLKTNPHGVFATYNPLESGDYLFEIKDPNQGYFFDTMNVHIEDSNKAYEFYSKEMI